VVVVVGVVVVKATVVAVEVLVVALVWVILVWVALVALLRGIVVVVATVTGVVVVVTWAKPKSDWAKLRQRAAEVVMLSGRMHNDWGLYHRPPLP
jgi:hypothetical protein